MPDTRLSSDIRVYALIRRVQLGGSFATLLRKGDARGGAVLIKNIDRRTGDARLWSEAVRGDGETFWMRTIASRLEADVDGYIERAVQIDPDIWIVEIEDVDGARFLTEPVERDDGAPPLLAP
jgi:hypothetical protein